MLSHPSSDGHLVEAGTMVKLFRGTKAMEEKQKMLPKVDALAPLLLRPTKIHHDTHWLNWKPTDTEDWKTRSSEVHHFAAQGGAGAE